MSTTFLLPLDSSVLIGHRLPAHGDLGWKRAPVIVVGLLRSLSPFFARCRPPLSALGSRLRSASHHNSPANSPVVANSPTSATSEFSFARKSFTSTRQTSSGSGSSAPTSAGYTSPQSSSPSTAPPPYSSLFSASSPLRQSPPPFSQLAAATTMSLGTLDRLPLELVLVITALATDPPLSLDAPTFDEKFYPPSLLLAFYTHTQLARLRLARVCQALNALILPLLYRHVWLHRRSHARRLAQTLQAHPLRASWIRRFDADTSAGGQRTDAMQTSGLDIRIIVDALAAAGRASELHTFVDRRAVYVNVGDPRVHCPVLLAQIVLACASTLRRVHVTCYTDPGRAHWLANLMPLVAAPALEELAIDAGLSIPNDVRMSFKSPREVAQDYVGGGGLIPRYPSVKTFEVILPADLWAADVAFEMLALCSMPSVSCIRLSGGVPDTPTASLLHFFQVHGNKVQALELGSPRPSLHPFLMAATSSAALQLALPATLPMLHTLICTASRSNILPHSLFAAGHPRVRNIGLKVCLHASLQSFHLSLCCLQSSRLPPTCQRMHSDGQRCYHFRCTRVFSERSCVPVLSPPSAEPRPASVLVGIPCPRASRSPHLIPTSSHASPASCMSS